MNFIFDIGNVLVTYQPALFLEELFRDKALAERLHRLIFLSQEWQRLDLGEITQAEAFDLFCLHEPGLEAEIRETKKNVNGIFSPIAGTIELLPGLKASGHKLYYLSNISTEIGDHLLCEHEFFNLFDGGVFSCDIHINKPSPGIYRHLLGKYNLDPAECMFFDDMEVNVAAAVKEGIKSFLFTDAECLKPFTQL